MRRQVWGKTLQVGWFMGLLLLLSMLAGCSLFLPEGPDELTGPGKGDSTAAGDWLVAAQGQDGPPGCGQELSPGQAKKVAARLLASKQEVRLLKEALEQQGKRLQLGKAHGCKVKAHSQVTGQGLFALEEMAAEATLIEVPAGTDAALYLFESPTGDGNEWASLKETTADGERLIHLEVGIADDPDIQGLSEAEVGEMSLFLPDDTGIQEVAADVQQLLLGNSEASGVGVQALEAGGYDWARAEVILDDSQVTVNADGSEELEALLVVPEAGTGGEALWGRTRPMIDEGRALYAIVKVKRTASTSSTTRRTLKVTTPPAQVKRGSELKFEPFDLCPYRNYGRVAAFRRALCYQWEQRAARKVQKVTFDRIVRNLPDIHSRMPAAAQWQDMNERERNNFIDALNAIQGHDDPMAAAASYYGSATFPAYTKVIDRIIRALQQYLGITSVEQAKAEALRIMGVFVSTMKRSPNPGVMMDLATQGGPAGIIAFVKLMEAQQYADAKYVFPEDIVGFFEKVLQLKSILTGGWSLFLKHLAAAAAQAVAKVGTSEGEAALEMIARLTLLQDLFSKMHQKGWEWLEYGYSGGAGWAGPFFDFYGKKTFDVSGIGDYLWHIVGWVEPYLSQGDVDRILQQIENAANWILRSISFSISFGPFAWGPFFSGRKQAIVQVIDNYDPSALADLCSYVSSRYYGVPVVIIVDGQVACHSPAISAQGAQAICEQMGQCTDSGSSGSGGQNGSPPDGTYSVPMGDPYTGQCPPGYSFCMI